MADPLSDVQVRIGRVALPRTARIGAEELALAVQRELEGLLRVAPAGGPSRPAAAAAPLSLDATIHVGPAATSATVARALAMHLHRRLTGPERSPA
jgi:hypothetical protein